MKDKTRLIALSDSPEMDGELVIFETNAPSKRLKELEKEKEPGKRKLCIIYGRSL